MKTFFKHWNLRNIKHPKTTFLGLVIFTITLILVAIGKATFSEVWPAWIFVLGFFGMKDGATGLKLIFLLLSFSFLITSCTPTKRLERLQSHHPELFNNEILYLIDTITIDSSRIDTIVSIKNLLQTDTFKLYRDKIKIQIIRTGDSLKITGTTPPDTIIIRRTIEITKPSAKQQKPTIKNYLIAFGTGFLLCAIFYSIIALKRK